MNLFGKKKAAPPPPNTTDTINNLRVHIETLDKREQHIYTKMDSSVKEATMKMKRGDKKGALFALKRKKMFEGEITKLQGARMTLENQISALESASINVSVFKAMEGASKNLSQIRGDLDATTVDEIMADIQEEQDISNAISEAISRPAEEMFDDEELLQELAELEELEAASAVHGAPSLAQSQPAQNQQQPAIGATMRFPDAPNAQPIGKASVQESEEEASIRQLEAMMAL